MGYAYKDIVKQRMEILITTNTGFSWFPFSIPIEISKQYLIPPAEGSTPPRCGAATSFLCCSTVRLKRCKIRVDSNTWEQPRNHVHTQYTAPYTPQCECVAKSRHHATVHEYSLSCHTRWPFWCVMRLKCHSASVLQDPGTLNYLWEVMPKGMVKQRNSIFFHQHEQSA